MAVFESLTDQAEARRRLEAALAEGPAHAYLFHGPKGVGKRRAALAFAGEILGDPDRAGRLAHPDLYPLEPLGEMIRIDEIRRLRHDLHMRPFEADRRVYVIFQADRMNAEAADALLKDLEEPPDYAVIVLVADDLGPLPETLRSRCQLVPFRRLPERAIRAELAVRAPGLDADEAAALARVAAGRLDRLERLLDPEAQRRRAALLGAARAVYREAAFDPGAAAGVVLAAAGERGAEAKDAEQAAIEGLGLPQREAEQRVKRAQRGAEREEVLAALEELEGWFRDLLVVGVGADAAAIHRDRLAELREDATAERLAGAERGAETIREAWRVFEEFNVSPELALEALFVELRTGLAGSPV